MEANSKIYLTRKEKVQTLSDADYQNGIHMITCQLYKGAGEYGTSISISEFKSMEMCEESTL